jgi:phosphate transport system protein
MTLRLDSFISEIEKKMFMMMDLTSQIINSALGYYIENKESFLNSVNNLEEKINEYENKIDEAAIRIFALHQPFAFDLRKVVMMIKMNIDLERIGDLAYSITHRIKATLENKFYNVDKNNIHNKLIISNFERISEMLLMLKRSFGTKEIGTFKDVIDMDQRIDQNNTQIFRESLKAVTKNSDHINFYINQITISKSLERMGDHCTNIAQDLIYVFTGINIKHREYKE